MTDPEIFGPIFQPLDSWHNWIVALKAFDGLPMTEEELIIFRHFTGRTVAPTVRARAGSLICGRQAGKSRIVALKGIHQTFFVDHSPYMAPRQKTVCMILSQDRRGGGVIFGYMLGMIESVPALADMIVRVVEGGEQKIIQLANGIDIEIYASNFRAVRGPMAVCVLADETAQWWNQEDSANPDSEVLAAAAPATLHVPTGFVLSLSSPYARRGTLWESYEKHYGRDGDPELVWKAATTDMFPGADAAIIAKAYEDDPQKAGAEYGGEFRTDVSSYVPPEIITETIIAGRTELAPQPSLSYVAFCDPSGGAVDSYTMAIAHAGAGGRLVLDLVRERKPPFSPDAVAAEYAALCSAYRVTRIVGDRYGGEAYREPYRTRGIGYVVSDKVRSEIYLALLPLLNSRRVELLDVEAIGKQLGTLERRTNRAGRDSVDHGVHGKDDVINSVAGALVLAATRRPEPQTVEEEEAQRPEGGADEYFREQRDGPGAEKVEQLVRYLVQKMTEARGAGAGAQKEAALRQYLDTTPAGIAWPGLMEHAFEMLGFRRMLDAGFMSRIDAEDRLLSMIGG